MYVCVCSVYVCMSMLSVCMCVCARWCICVVCVCVLCACVYECVHVCVCSACLHECTHVFMCHAQVCMYVCACEQSLSQSPPAPKAATFGLQSSAGRLPSGGESCSLTPE